MTSFASLFLNRASFTVSQWKNPGLSIAFLFLFLSPLSLFAQPLLSVEEAVKIGLENNHAIVISRDQVETATLNRQTGVGNFLPGVSASANQSGTWNHPTPRTSVGASLNWLIFDGFQSYHGYRRLQTAEQAASFQDQAVVEGTLEGILAGYYDIVRVKLRLDAITELLSVSEERARLAQALLEVGSGSRLEQLQALADLNEDSSAFISQQQALLESKVRLNQLLARDVSVDFFVSDSIPLEFALPLEQWKAGLTEQNSVILTARANRKASELGVRQARGGYLPNFSGSVGYGITPDFLNTQPGGIGSEGAVEYRLSLSIPIFNRFQTRREIGTARLGLRQEETRLQLREEEVRGEYEQAVHRHTTGVRQVNLEERNLEVARLQAEAAQERFRVGASSPLEFRDAQRRLLDAQSRLAAARFDTKRSELALKRLACVLVQQAPGVKAAQ